MRDAFRIHHSNYGHGWARGKVRDGQIECRFGGPLARVFGGRWVPMRIKDLSRVTLEPMG